MWTSRAPVIKHISSPGLSSVLCLRCAGLLTTRSGRLLLLLALIASFTSCSTSRKAVDSFPEKTANSSSTSVQLASRLIGSKYKYGGNSPKGFDCSGLVFYVYQQQRIELPRTSKQQSKIGERIAIKDLQMGDLVFLGKGHVEHVGIVEKTKHNQMYMIHASSSKGVVRTEIFSSPYWSKRLLFGRRIHE